MTPKKRVANYLRDGSISREDLNARRYYRNKKLILQGDFGPSVTPPLSEDWLSDWRTPTEKDRDRILYSPYLRRLAGVTQIVTPPTESAKLHSRLAHSMKVGNLARAIAADFCRQARTDRGLLDKILEHGGIDIAACEAAGLAHDIGHPPFGHIGEEILDRWLKERGCTNGFEGNAQTFRTLTKLDFISEDSNGLEITNVTKAAVLKYPWTRIPDDAKRDSKFGALNSEFDEFQESRLWYESDVHEDDARLDMQTLEASIMDVADDITYALHDLQDFILSGMINVFAIQRDLRDAIDWVEEVEKDFAAGLIPSREQWLDKKRKGELTTFYTQAKSLRRHYPSWFKLGAYKDALEYAGKFLEELDSRDRDELQRTANATKTTSTTIGDLILKLQIGKPQWDFGPSIYLHSDPWHKVQVLKEISKKYVIQTAAVGLHQASEQVVLENVLERLDSWTRTKGSKDYLPARLASLIKLHQEEVERLRSGRSGSSHEFAEDIRRRAIVDYCCTLTDHGTYQLHRFLQGHEMPRIIL